MASPGARWPPTTRGGGRTFVAGCFVMLFVVLAARVAIVANIGVPDVQLSTANLWDGLT
jgi:hypothetical protein